MTAVTLRRAVADDIDEVLAIERASFGDPWSRAAFEFALGSDVNIFEVAFDSESGRIVGFAIWEVVLPEAALCDIAISPECRRCGIGEMLVRGGLCELAEQGTEHIYLDVRVSNAPAATLYKKLGFVPIGRRRNYYSSPREDAIMMHLELERSTN